ncbi:MAG: hypothetical protein WCH62_00670 [Candidatus Omnitrophota bacterium]
MPITRKQTNLTKPNQKSHLLFMSDLCSICKIDFEVTVPRPVAVDAALKQEEIGCVAGRLYFPPL